MNLFSAIYYNIDKHILTFDKIWRKKDKVKLNYVNFYAIQLFSHNFENLIENSLIRVSYKIKIFMKTSGL